MKPPVPTIHDLWQQQLARKARRERVSRALCFLLPALLGLVLHCVW